MAQRIPGTVGFALGGLGGFNAYGVGFLQAARALGIKPDIITCTSGMIGWVAEWLEGKDLWPGLERQIAEGNKFPPPFDWMNSIWMSMFGDPGIFRPAVPEYWLRWMSPTSRIDTKTLLDRLYPAQMYVPTRPPEDFSHIAHVMNHSDTPVVFNSFHPKSGMGYLHINDAACAFLKAKYGETGGPEKYRRITPEAVRGALWLYMYGFSHQDNPYGLVDGAYNRQIIVRELHACDRLYAARPLNTRWIGHLPENGFETQDFTTELWLNSAYAAEVAGIDQINHLIEHGKLNVDEFHKVKLIPVEIPHQDGFFRYFVERETIYQHAYEQATKAFQHNEW